MTRNVYTDFSFNKNLTFNNRHVEAQVIENFDDAFVDSWVKNMNKIVDNLCDVSKQNEILRLVEKVHTFFICEKAKDISKSRKQNIKRFVQDVYEIKSSYILVKCYVGFVVSEIENAKNDLR